MTPITAEGYARPLEGEVSAGPAPMLQWLPIADLVIDPSYQREIGRAGARNVNAIIRAFCWSKFAAVVVAPIEGGKYAIVDGQHRTTAALACGFSQVPCQVIIADRAAQAEAFTAINGQVTPITALALHRSRIAAGEADALAINAACAAADVTVCRYPKPTAQMKAGETMAVGTIAKMLAAHGHDHVVTALQCVTRTGEGNPGMLIATVIKGFSIALEVLPAWREAGGALLEALDEFDIESAFEAATTGGARHGGMKAPEAFALAVQRHLAGREVAA